MIGRCMLKDMNRELHIGARISEVILLALVCVAVFVPVLTHAQAQTDTLRATIRAELLSDPRTTGLSKTQLDAMVDLLTGEAQKQGITSHDITWRPQSANSFGGANSSSASASSACGGIPSILCMLSEAFGFTGSDVTIPFALGAASMGLVWILAEMIHRRRYPGVVPPRTDSM